MSGPTGAVWPTQAQAARALDRPAAPAAATLPDGTPHADPFLAERGWQAEGGVYVRRPAAGDGQEAGQ